jgi:Putative adhesin
MSGFGWKAVGGLLAIGTVGWGAFNVVTLVAHEERTEVRTYDAADVRVIDVESSAGSVTIEGAPGRDEITVTAHISDGLRETGERQALIDGRLELRASCPVIGSDWCNVKYTIEAPADVEVRAESDTGRLTVRRVDGPVDLQADNGSVEVAELSGRLTIGADNGAITGSRLAADTVMADTNNGSVALEFVEPPTTVDARSDNGRVEVVLPDTEDFYNLDITTDNGEVSRDIRNDPTSSRRITIQTDNGDVTARYGP